MSTPGWYPDPAGQHALRYWDGAAWTEHVQDAPADAPPTAPLTAPSAPPFPQAPQMPRMPQAPQMPHAPGGPTPFGSSPIVAPVEKASRPGAAWAVIGILVLVVFAAAYLIATRVGGDDESADDVSVPDLSIPSFTVPPLSIPDVTVPGITIPAITVPGETVFVTLPGTLDPGTVDPAATATPAAVSETQPVVVGGASLPMLVEDGNPDALIGTPAPTIQGMSFDGTPVTVSAGPSATLVVYLAHWCPHCQREVPRLVEWAASGTMPAGLNVVGIATATEPSRDNFPPSAWLQREGFPFPVMADSPTYDAAAALGVSGFPFFALIGADGSVLDRFSGEIEMTDLTARISADLGG